MAGTLSQFAGDVRAGLSKTPQRELPSQYFYDELGSTLFDAITCLPEYGLTRADIRLLTDHAAEIASSVAPDAVIAELGSGSGRKTIPLLQHASMRAGGAVAYYPIDVSPAALELCRAQLARDAGVHPVCASYLDGLAQVSEARDDRPLLLLFVGSTIGNFDLACAREFLIAVRGLLRRGDALLLGADLVKPREQLLAAYDDPTGVTAAFNRNVLGRINRELGGNFRLECFAHEARWNEARLRVEMHLAARGEQRVRIAALDDFEITLRDGETIWTESSHKFRRSDLDAMAAETRFTPRECWLDEEWPFAECLWTVD